jgi:endonuclease V-like protein UPF0215 family
VGARPLKPTRIRQAKRNIRVLGLAAAPLGDGFVAVGAVVRGRLGLEGVLHSESTDGDVTEGFVGALLRSRHLGQVRVIVVDAASLPPGCQVDPARLAEGSGKPVLALDAEDAAPGGVLRWRGYAVACVGLDEADACGVLDAVSVDGYPEALRVAALAAGGLAGLGMHKV